MPTSATGIWASSQRRPARAPLAPGFTLLELLVVLFIVGITLAFATLSIGDHSGAERLQREADRLQQLMHLAADDAVLFGLEMGLDITPDGYRFLRLDADGWQPLDGQDNPLRPRKLADGMRLRLLDTGNDNKPGDLLAPRGADDDTPTDNNNDSGFSFSDSDQDQDKSKGPQPEILFLSSGEQTGYRLELHADGVVPRFIYQDQPGGKPTMQRELPGGS